MYHSPPRLINLNYWTNWCHPRFELNISKMGSWNHMGHTGNMIIKDFIRQMCVPLENSVYFGDWDVPITKILFSKGTHICLMKSLIIMFPCHHVAFFPPPNELSAHRPDSQSRASSKDPRLIIWDIPIRATSKGRICFSFHISSLSFCFTTKKPSKLPWACDAYMRR